VLSEEDLNLFGYGDGLAHHPYRRVNPLADLSTCNDQPFALFYNRVTLGGEWQWEKGDEEEAAIPLKAYTYAYR